MGPPTQGPPPTTGVTSPKESEIAVHMDVSAMEPQEEAGQLPDGRGTSLVVEETADAVSTPTAADGNGVRCPCGFNEVRPAQHTDWNVWSAGNVGTWRASLQRGVLLLWQPAPQVVECEGHWDCLPSTLACHTSINGSLSCVLCEWYAVCTVRVGCVV